MAIQIDEASCNVELSDFDLAAGKELQRIASLRENWDSQGAKPVDSEIIAAARAMISALPGRVKSGISVPAIVPMRKGNLQFEWHKGPKTLELEIESPRTVHYLKWHVEAGIEEEDCCALSDTDTLIALIEWFSKG